MELALSDLTDLFQDNHILVLTVMHRNEISTHRIFSFFHISGKVTPTWPSYAPLSYCLMFIKYWCISEVLKKQDKTETVRSLGARASEVLECSSILTGREHYKLKRSLVTASQASPLNTSAAGQSEGATDSDSGGNWNRWGWSSVSMYISSSRADLLRHDPNFFQPRQSSSTNSCLCLFLSVCLSACFFLSQLFSMFQSPNLYLNLATLSAAMRCQDQIYPYHQSHFFKNMGQQMAGPDCSNG